MTPWHLNPEVTDRLAQNMANWLRDPARVEAHLKLRTQAKSTEEGFQMYIAWCKPCDEWYLEDGTYTEHDHEKDQEDE